MGRGIWSFSKKLHETGNGALGEHHAVFCKLREDWVSSKSWEMLHDPRKESMTFGFKTEE